MWRGSSGTRRSGCRRSVTVQPLLLTSQSTYAPTASGSDSSISVAGTKRRRTACGTGRATTDGCADVGARCARAACIAPAAFPRRRPSPARTPRSPRAECSAPRGNSGEAPHSWRPTLEQLADAPIHIDIGAAEAVNRLLRITDDEQLAGHRRDVFPPRLALIASPARSSSSSACSGSVSWNSSTKMRLKRFWKCTPHRRHRLEPGRARGAADPGNRARLRAA